MAAVYLDASAIVKLVMIESESQVLRRHLRRRRPWVTSALARTEVLRAVRSEGEVALAAGRKVLARCDLVRVSDRVLNRAAEMEPDALRSLDAIHLATAERLGSDLGGIVTYDDRMAHAARRLGLRVSSPA